MCQACLLALGIDPFLRSESTAVAQHNHSYKYIKASQ